MGLGCGDSCYCLYRSKCSVGQVVGRSHLFRDVSAVCLACRLVRVSDVVDLLFGMVMANPAGSSRSNRHDGFRIF